MLAYGVLLAVACLVLRGRVLGAVVILLAGLLIKTLLAMKASVRVPD